MVINTFKVTIILWRLKIQLLLYRLRKTSYFLHKYVCQRIMISNYLIDVTDQNTYSLNCREQAKPAPATWHKQISYVTHLINSHIIYLFKLLENGTEDQHHCHNQQLRRSCDRYLNCPTCLFYLIHFIL